MRHRAIALASCMIFCAGCDREQAADGATAASASQPGAPAASAPPAAPAKPWYEGSWRGRYEARHFKIEMAKKDGMIKQWAEDDGKTASGAGELMLKIDDAGQVSGTGQGPLGALILTGEVDGDRLRVKLQPVDPAAEGALAGFLLATRKGEAFSGKLQASSGDSLVVRDAPVELRKEGSGAAQK
jgi:hypothetical protein